MLTSTLLALALSAGESGAAPCPGAANLEGPPAITTPIARGLRAHGVAVGTPSACSGRTVRAVVTSASPAKGYKLHIEDGFGRISDRVIATPEVAVSLIESWVVDDESDLLAVAPPSSATPPVVVTARATAQPVGAAPRLRLYGGPTGLLGSERSLWAGAAVGGCGSFGVACLGLDFTFARSLALRGDTADAGASRTLADGFIFAGLPLARGRLFVLPTIGVGGGWVRTHVAAEDGDTPAVTANTFGLRGKLAVMGGVSLSSHLGLALEIAGLVAPGARPSPSEEAMSQTSSLPGEPRASLRTGLICVVTL